MDPAAWNTYLLKFKDPLGIVNSIYNIDIYDMDTAINDLRSGKFLPDTLIIESFTVGKKAPNIDAINDVFYMAFLITRKLSVRGSSYDQTEKDTLLNETYNKADLIMKTMISDKINNCDFMDGLEINSILIQKVGPVLDEHFGWRVSFEVHCPND